MTSSDVASADVTDPPRAASRLRLIDVAGIGLLLGVLFVVIRPGSGPVGNTDVYFHLRFGAEFLNGWSLISPGSVTPLGTREWLPSQWSAQMLMAQIESWGGLRAVAFYLRLTSVAFVLSVYLLCRRAASPVAAALVTGLATLAASGGLSGRPQVLSFILIAVCVGLWLRARETGRVPWLLVPLTWIWVTAHGMWLLGIVISVAAVVGIALDRRPPRRELLRLAAVPVASVAVACLTPLGLSAWTAVLHVGGISEYFAEWGPPDFTRPAPLVVAAMLALTLLIRLRTGGLDWTHTLLLLLAGGFALYALRTIPVAAVMVAPLLAAALQRLVGPVLPRRRPEALLVAAITLVALVLLAVRIPPADELPYAQPAWAADRLDALPAGTVLINEWADGGYLMWRHPELAIVSHGYGDTFTTEELDRNVALARLEPGWDEKVDEIGASVAYLSEDSPLGYALQRSGDWRVLEDSEGYLLLERVENG